MIAWLTAIAVVSLVAVAVVATVGYIQTRDALTQAEQQGSLARESAARAESQRQRAESNFDRALNAIHRLLDKLDGKAFSDLSAVPEVRRRLTAHAVHLYEEFVDEGSTDPAVRQDTARAYQAIAMLYSGQADRKAARSAFEKAATILEALVTDYPEDPIFWLQLGFVHVYFGDEFEYMGFLPEAAEERHKAAMAFSQAVQIAPHDPRMLENWAYCLVANREPRLRDPERAVALATKAAQLEPGKWVMWNTLGLAQYRAGDPNAAIESLEKGLSLRKGGDGGDWFLLAMVHCRLGHKEEAEQWNDRAVKWMEEHLPHNEGLKRLREEAAGLLRIKDTPVSASKEAPAPQK